ncbi:MAG: hypothetical protein VXY92_04280 [Planctomycetota bacterium]|nr:hypothetical protein [Planctomycetota bacterium]
MLDRRSVFVIALAALVFCCAPLTAQKKRRRQAGAGRLITEFPGPEKPPIDVAAATATALEQLLSLEEKGGQWPYEGVYREDRGALPQGYRVGGTSISILGMVCAPGYRDDDRRVAAVERALRFVLKTLKVDRMQEGFQGGYDVRGWGHIYALTCLLYLKDFQLVPAALAEQVDEKTSWLVEVLVASAIPKNGGWNYSRRRGYMSPRNPASTFMTAPALQALFHAQARGHDVPDDVVEQALAALERSRSEGGGYAYGAPAKSRNDGPDEERGLMDKTPSAAARAAVCETTLMLAGRGDAARHAAAVKLFYDHWDDLAVRKSQQGTHIPPYGIAPYYFMFGHMYCAQAVEQLADEELRDECRTRMRVMLARGVEASGAWNDRQFGRSAGYGTAMALLAMHMPRLPKPHTWGPGASKK